MATATRKQHAQATTSKAATRRTLEPRGCHRTRHLELRPNRRADYARGTRAMLRAAATRAGRKLGAGCEAGHWEISALSLKRSPATRFKSGRPMQNAGRGNGIAQQAPVARRRTLQQAVQHSPLNPRTSRHISVRSGLLLYDTLCAPACCYSTSDKYRPHNLFVCGCAKHN